MSRSAADATRFTATSPHAYSKPPTTRPLNAPFRAAQQQHPPPSSSSSSSSSPAMNNTTFNRSSPASRTSRSPGGPSGPSGPTETPQQKVARLRAARLAARDAQVSTWDRVVVSGRVWADRAHRFTVTALMGFTVLAGGITVFALSDMIIYNRRKRASYFAEQTALLHAQLAAAIAADKAGEPLNEGQVLLLNRERARVEGEERAKREKGWWWKWMIRGLDAEEGTGGEGGGGGAREEQQEQQGHGHGGDGIVISAVEEEMAREAFGQAEALTATESSKPKPSSVLQALEDQRREGGEPVEEAGRAKGGWTSWMIRKE